MILCEDDHKKIEYMLRYKTARRYPEIIKKYNDELIRRGLQKWMIK